MGFLGDVSKGIADIGWANMWVVPYKAIYMDFTRPYYIDQSCYLVKVPETSSANWKSLALAFAMETWIAAIVTFILSMIFLSRYNKLNPNRYLSRRGPGLIHIAITLKQSYSVGTVMGKNIRVLLAAYLLGFFVLTTAYQGTLTSRLTVTYPPAPIDTLKDLAESNLPVGINGPDLSLATKESQDENMKAIAKRLVHFKSMNEALEDVSKGDLVIGQSRKALDFIVRKQFTNKLGISSLHITSKCFLPFPVSFFLPKDSLYTAKFSQLIDRLYDAGLLNYWYQLELDKVSRIIKGMKLSTKKQALNITHMFSPFIICIILLVISSFVFIFELISKRKIQPTN